MAQTVLRGERTGLEKKFFDMCSKVVTENGYELYDMDWIAGSGELRLSIMDPKTGSAIIDDCAKIDHALTPYFESETWMPDDVTLEVSSPGLFRSLTSIEHFKLVVEKNILITLNKNISEEQSADLPKAFRHNMKPKVKLMEVFGDAVAVEIKNVKVVIPFSQIKKANLETDLKDNEED